jgi:hypothetical protein
MQQPLTTKVGNNFAGSASSHGKNQLPTVFPSRKFLKPKTNSVAFSPQEKYMDRATAAVREINANFAGRGCCVVSAAEPYGR